VSAPNFYRRRCRRCRKQGRLLLAQVFGPFGQQRAPFTLCRCDAASQVPTEWKSVTPCHALMELVRRIGPESPVRLEGVSEAMSKPETLIAEWGDLTKERLVSSSSAQRESAGAAADQATERTTGNTGGNQTGSNRGLVFDAASQYVQRGYPVVLLHGVQGAVCTCPRRSRCKSPGKHPVSLRWAQHAIRRVEELAAQWDARNGRPTNIGILLDDASRLLLLDVDVKNGKQGRETLAEWSRTLGVNLSRYLVQVTPNGGEHCLFRVPNGFDPQSLPNRNEVGPGIDVFHVGKQFVVSPSTTASGEYYYFLGEACVLPPIDEVPEAPGALLTYLQTFDRPDARAHGPVDDLKSLEAPSIETLREAVAHIPNDETVPREHYIWMASHIKAAGGADHEAEAREIFLEWAGRHPSADREEDERVWDTLPWSQVRGGWPELWPVAAKYGYDASKQAHHASNEPAAVRVYRAVLANPDIHVFHGARDRRPYIRIRHRGHWQTHSLESSSGIDLLRYVMSRGSSPPSPQTFTQAVDHLRSYARFEAERRDVFLRVARVGSTVYVDLGDDTFRAVEVTASGWRVIADPAVLFVRRPGMRALPEPVDGGSLDDFNTFFLTGSEDDLRLQVTFLVDTFLAPEGAARPMLVFGGPPGSAKTTMTRFSKELTDPQVGGVFSLPESPRDLVIAAQSNHVVALDNASTISNQMSDALSRLTAGGGLRTRKLYTDEDETIFDELRHVIVNSVGDVAKQNDLRDRALFVFTRRLKDRRSDDELERSFHAAAPKLLGFLLDAVAMALANEGAVQVPASELPRMAGFATRGAACAPALGWSPAQFLSAYRANIDCAAADYLDNDLVAHAIISVSWQGVRAWYKARLAERGLSESKIAGVVAPERWTEGVVWRGSAADLLAYLEERLDASVTRKKGWPGDVRYFGRRLNEAAGPLRAAGWAVEPDRKPQERTIIITRIGGWSSKPPDLDDATGSVLGLSFC
jgi:hypothetical protein